MMSDDFTVNFWHFFRREKLCKNCRAPPPRSKNHMHIFRSYTIRTFEKIPSSKKSAHFFFFLLFFFSFKLFRFLVLLWIRYLLIRIKVRWMKIKSFTGVHLTSFFHEKIAVEMPAKLKWYSTWETSKRSQLIRVLTGSFLVYLCLQITFWWFFFKSNLL